MTALSTRLRLYLRICIRHHATLVAIAVVMLEAAAAMVLLWGLGAPAVLGAGMCHVAAALGAGMLGYLTLPAHHREPAPGRRGSVQPEQAARQRICHGLWFAAVVLFMPVLGLAGLLAAVLPGLYGTRPASERPWQRVAVMPLSERRGAALMPAWLRRPLIEILQAPDATDQQRMDVVLALRHLPARAAVPLLRLALRDPADDVRLLAYAMLDRRTSAIEARIHSHEAALDRDALTQDQALAQHYALAHLHWELVHSGLVTGAVEERALARAAHHARAALAAGEHGEHAPEHEQALLYLLGRILLAQSAWDQAEATLIQAQERGFASSPIQLHLAEIAFFRRRWDAVAKHLADAAADSRELPDMAALVHRYWHPGPTTQTTETTTETLRSEAP